uniref:HAT C-terminal dimerisation domain-containing protein n=1 Tax=Poecilia reticulata TaxID=8081 RepID=A0A3P9NB26_POERE
MAQNKTKCRQYSIEYLDYGFIPFPINTTSAVFTIYPTQVQKSLSLGNDTVAHRMNEMGVHKEEQLCAILRNFPFTLQLDETTTPDINALLMAYVCFKGPSSEDMTIFNGVHGFLQEKSIPITNILEQVLKVLTVKCVLYCHNLVAKCKNPALNESLSIAAKAVNKIKAHHLLHTNVPWLSKGNCLVRFCSLFDSIVTSTHCDIRYPSDIFEKMNSHIKAPRKWHSCPVQSSHPQSHFPQLTKVVIIINYTYLISMNYCIPNHYRCLRSLPMTDSSFTSCLGGSVDCKIAIQEHLVDVQAIFCTLGWGSMWTKYATRYQAFWEKARLLLVAFPTTYLVEQAFNQVLHMQSKYRNRLDLAASGALWLKLTCLQPATKKLAEKHQVQGSH